MLVVRTYNIVTFRRAKVLVNGVVEDAGGATNLPVLEYGT